MYLQTYSFFFILLIINNYLLYSFSLFSFLFDFFMEAELPIIVNSQLPSVNFSFSGFPPKETKVFSGNLDLLYRKNKFQFSNKLTINHTSSGDPVVAFSEYAKANPYYEKKPDGRVEKWLEYKEELIESPNPLWNANLNSRALDRSFGVTNNFSAEYNPLTSLKIRGRFGITKTINESDDFLSPEDTSFDDTEELKKGSLAYQNGKNLQYEGELKWNENGDYSGVFICSGILIPICRYVDLLAD